MELSNKDKLEMYGDYLNEFKNPIVNEIVRKIIVNTPTNGVSGLVKHSVATMLMAKDLLDNDTVMWIFRMTVLTKLDKEIILASCLVHDNAKYGATDIREIAKNAGLYNELQGENLEILNRIIKLIETHKDQLFNRIQKYSDNPSIQAAQAFVHMCDYVVSRKTFDNVSEISLPSEVDPELTQWFKSQI